MDDIEDQCTCWVCFEMYKDPITLMCQHSFCKDCLTKVYKRDAQCPFCRRPFGLPLPPTNPTLKNLVEDYVNRNTARPDVEMVVPVVQDAYIFNVPYDSIVETFLLLSPKDVARASRVCKVWNTLSNNSFLWRTFATSISPFCNIEKYNKNWRACFVGLMKRKIGWNSGKAGDFEVVTMRGHQNYITRFIQIQNKIISASADANLKIWPVHKSTATATLSGHTSVVDCVQSTNLSVASGSSDGTAKLWDLGTGINTSTFQHGQPVKSIFYDGNTILTASNSLKAWDARSGQETHHINGVAAAPLLPLHPFLPHHNNLANITDIQKDDAGRFITCSGGSIKVIDLRIGEDNRIFLGPAAAVNNVVQTFAGANVIKLAKEKLICGDSGGRVHIYNLNTNMLLHSIQTTAAAINCLEVDASTIATGHHSGAISVVNITGGNVRTFSEHQSPVHSLQFDDNKLVSGSADNSLKVWNIKTGARLYSLLGGSLQQRGNNQPNPTKPGCSQLAYDDGGITASFGSLMRTYNFEPPVDGEQ